MFIISKGLSEIDRRNLNASSVVAPEAPKKTSGEVSLESRGVRWKDLNFRTAREWGCTFCKRQTPTGQKRCVGCGSFLFQMGDLEFVYKTANGKQLTSDQRRSLKELVLNDKSAAK